MDFDLKFFFYLLFIIITIISHWKMELKSCSSFKLTEGKKALKGFSLLDRFQLI